MYSPKINSGGMSFSYPTCFLPSNVFSTAAAKESGVASDALSEDDFEAGVFDDDDIDDDDEVEEEEEENTDFIEITDDENVGAGVSEPHMHITLKWDTSMTSALRTERGREYPIRRPSKRSWMDSIRYFRLANVELE